MRAITAVNREIEVPEGGSNNRAGPVKAKLGKQAVEHKKVPDRINPRTEEIPRRTEKKEGRFKKEKDRKEKTIVLKEFWSQASRPFRLVRVAPRRAQAGM